MEFCDNPLSEEPLALMSLSMAAFENAPDGVLIFNADRSRVLASRQIARFFGRGDPGGCRLFPGLIFGSICRSCPESGCVIDCCVRRLIEERRDVPGVTLIDADRGEGDVPRWYLVRGTPFTLDGVAHGILSFADVTGSKRLEENLLQKLELDLSTLTMNKSGLMRAANRLLALKNRRGFFSLCMVDFDAFKAINDRYGHLMGDEVLLTFSQIARRSIRAQDVIGRYGGEEFVFLFPDTTPEEAAQVLHRIQREISAHFAGLLDQPVSFSGGLVYVETGAEPRETGIQLIGRADQLLYRAKQQGKARLVASDWEYLLL